MGATSGRSLSDRYGAICRLPLCILFLALLASGAVPPTSTHAAAAQLPAIRWTDAAGEALDLPVDALLALLRDGEVIARSRFDEGGRPRAFDDTEEGERGSYHVTLRHDSTELAATFRSHDDRFQVAHFEDGSTAVHFRDFGLFECAAWELARAAGVELVLPAVVRRIDNVEGCLQLRLVDAITESQRASEGRTDPAEQRWHKQLATMNVFDALVGNTDRNRQNLLYDGTWRVWITDHTRAFTRDGRVDLAPLQAIEQRFWDGLSALTPARLREVVGRYLSGGELEGLLERRERIVAHFGALIQERGAARVVYGY